MKFFFSQRFPRKPNPFARSPSYLLSQLISKLSNPQRRHRGHPRLSIVVTSPFRFTAVLKHRSWNTVKRSWWGKILASGPVSPSCTLVIRRRGIGRVDTTPFLCFYYETKIVYVAPFSTRFRTATILLSSSFLSLSLSHSSFTRFFSTAFASLPLRIKFNTPVSWLIIFLHEILQASPVLRNGTPWLESRILTPSLHDEQLEFSLRILWDFPRKFYEIVSFSSFWN